MASNAVGGYGSSSAIATTVNGEDVYTAGTGTQAGNRLDGKLIVQGNEIKINVAGHGLLSPPEFTQLAGQCWRPLLFLPSSQVQ